MSITKSALTSWGRNLTGSRACGTALLGLGLAFVPRAALAETNWGEIGMGIAETAIFGIVGILMLVGAYYIWELITPYSVKEELIERQNVAVGIVVAAFILGTAIVIAAALAGLN